MNVAAREAGWAVAPRDSWAWTIAPNEQAIGAGSRAWHGRCRHSTAIGVDHLERRYLTVYVRPSETTKSI